MFVAAIFIIIVHCTIDGAVAQMNGFDYKKICQLISNLSTAWNEEVTTTKWKKNTVYVHRKMTLSVLRLWLKCLVLENVNGILLSHADIFIHEVIVCRRFHKHSINDIYKLSLLKILRKKKIAEIFFCAPSLNFMIYFPPCSTIAGRTSHNITFFYLLTSDKDTSLSTIYIYIFFSISSWPTIICFTSLILIHAFKWLSFHISKSITRQTHTKASGFSQWNLSEMWIKIECI